MSGDKDPLKTSSLEDDEFVSCVKCQIMFDINDETHALSVCFERCHSFCPSCIQSLVSSSPTDERKLDCPMCKISKTVDEIHEQLWCFECNVPASIGCFEENHIIQKYDDLFSARSLQLKLQINQTNSAIDHTLINCHQIQSAHQVILAWMQWLLLEINQWDSSNNATIAQLESLKVSEGFHIQQGKNLQCSINNINQHIVQLNERFQEVKASQLKVSQLLYTYSSCSTQQEFTPSAQTPSVGSLGSAELMKLFSTSFNQTNQSCINVLAFLISFLSQGKKNMKEGEQVSNDIADKAGMRRTGEFLKRRLEEDSESTTHFSKKAREESSYRSEPGIKLPSDLPSNGDNLAFKEAMEKHAELVRKLEETRDRLKLSEERSAILAEEAEKNKDFPSRIARLEADLELLAKHVEQAEESEAKAHQEALNEMESAKKTQEKYELELLQHSVDLEELKTVCEQYVKSRSQLASALHELSNRATPAEMEKLQRDKELLEKRLEQAQMEVEKMKEAREKSTIEITRTNVEFMTTQTKLTEEVRVAKEETRQLKSKLSAAMMKHLSELQQFRNYKTQFEELKIEYDKLVRENEKYCTNVAVSQAEQTKVQNLAKFQAEMKKGKPEIEEHEMSEKNPRLPLTKKQQQQKTASVVLNKPYPSTQNVTLTLSPQLMTQQNQMKGHNVPNTPVAKVKQSIKHVQIFNFNAIAKDILTEFNNNKELDWSVYPCSNCNSQVEMGFYCDECEDFQLCILCYKKYAHHHKMEKFGFNLDRNEDFPEERKSRIDRRIISFVHSFNCSAANCFQPYCRTMKEVAAHNCVCHAKARSLNVKSKPNSQVRCLVCRQLVGLVIGHAKYCTELKCEMLHCSNVKKKIKMDLSQKKNLFKPQKNLSKFQKKRENANLEPLGSRIQNRVSINATRISSAELTKTSLNRNRLQDTSPAVSFPLAVQNDIDSAPTSVGSVCSAIETSSTDATTHEENLKLVQDHVTLLVHAHKCQQGVNQANNTCSIQYCAKMKNHLNHVTSCQDGQSCQVPGCSYSKKIISHWRSCCLSDCCFCFGLNISDDDNYKDSNSRIGEVVDLMVKPHGAIKIAQGPSKLAAPSNPAASLPRLDNARPATATPSVNVSIGTQVDQVVSTVGIERNVTRGMDVDSEKRETLQEPGDSIPQQPPIKKTEHPNLSIVMGDGICCPVWAIDRERLSKLLLDPSPFGCNFRTTLKELLKEMNSPRVNEESRQRIANFFGTHYLFVCSFFRIQCEKSGL